MQLNCDITTATRLCDQGLRALHLNPLQGFCQ